MIVLTRAQRDALRCNAINRETAQATGRRAPDPIPVIKLFNPIGPGSWLATELAADGDALFGLADLGFGCPEVGYFSLGEIGRLSLPFGLSIECDITFEGRYPLSLWDNAARGLGSIPIAEQYFLRVRPKLPERP